MAGNKIHIPSWDEYFLKHVYLAASKSKDSSTQIGAVLIKDNAVVSEGYNGICRGVKECPVNNSERLQRPEKYFWFEHGERNAIYNAARRGIATEGCLMFTQGIPCADCARGVIQAGIKEIYVHRQWAEQSQKKDRIKWVESCARSMDMFNESGVKVFEIDLALGVKTLLDGEIIEV